MFGIHKHIPALKLRRNSVTRYHPARLVASSSSSNGVLKATRITIDTTVQNLL